MIRGKKAKRLLTNREQKHLTEAGIRNRAALKRQVDWGITQWLKCYHMPCWDCYHIALKLGVIVRDFTGPDHMTQPKKEEKPNA